MLRRLLGLNVMGSVLALARKITVVFAELPSIKLRAEEEWVTVVSIGDVQVTSEKGNLDHDHKAVVV